MSNFEFFFDDILNSNGFTFVNLDHVAKVVRTENADSALGYKYHYLDVQGRVLATADGSEGYCRDLPGTGQLIPAQPGFNALSRLAGTYDLSPTPIIAWRSAYGGLVAIGADGYSKYNQPIEWPDGQVSIEEGVFPNRAAYVLYLREEEARSASVAPLA